MCGICGVIGSPDKRETEIQVRRMMAALEHRGPDDEGVVLANGGAFGMRRLAIIDLPGGAQPVWNEAGTGAVILNGEIYNFEELRRELESLGHSFRTRSDTEVIIHAYEAWGADCVTRLRGMFALAVAEMPSGRGGEMARLFLARDRMGIKPLYYATVDGTFVFASEVRALLASGLIAPRIAAENVACYLLFGSVGEPSTLVEGVASLPPGHTMTLSAPDGWHVAEPKEYWSASEIHREAGKDGKSAAKSAPSRLRSLLEDTVRKHLIADVPVGVFLSSGIDSTALTALASRERRGVRTFTLAFAEKEFSEAEVARRTARRFGTDHREILLGGEEMLGRIDAAVSALDQPSMDGINTYFVSWAARESGLKVALSGLGSDEIFGGYSTFTDAPRLERLMSLARLLPHGVRKATAGMIGRRAGHSDGARKVQAAWMETDSLPHGYFFARALLVPEQARALLGGRASWRDVRPAWWKWIEATTNQTRRLQGRAALSWHELRTYMVNTLLRDTDAVSMRHSLEVRVPFLDHPLVEYALDLPPEVMRRYMRPKALLIAALEDLLPLEIVEQPKRTFTLPWAAWLRGALRQRVEEGLSAWSRVLEGIVPAAAARAVWNDFLAEETSWSRPWSLYVLNEWTRRNIENVPRPAERKTAAISGAC